MSDDGGGGVVMSCWSALKLPYNPLKFLHTLHREDETHHTAAKRS